jgi:hypothetical protein
MFKAKMRATAFGTILVSLLILCGEAVASGFTVVDFGANPAFAAANINTTVGLSNSAVLFQGAGPTGQVHAFLWDRQHGLRDIIPDPNAGVWPFAINSQGVVDGLYVPADGSPPYPFVWSEALGVSALGPLAGDASAFANFNLINDLGQVFGISTSADYSTSQNIIWDSHQVPHPLKRIADPNVYNVRALGDYGQVAGSYLSNPTDPFSATHAFVSLGPWFVDLHPAGNPYFSGALAVSGNCVAVTYLAAVDPSYTFGFFVNNGYANVPIGGVDTLDSMNQACEVLGTMSVDNSRHVYVAKLIQGSYTPIDLTPSARFPNLFDSCVTGAASINNSGAVIFNTQVMQGVVSANLWDGVRSSALPPTPGDSDTQAAAMNDQGWVSGFSGTGLARSFGGWGGGALCRSTGFSGGWTTPTGGHPVLWIPTGTDNQDGQ